MVSIAENVVTLDQAHEERTLISAAVRGDRDAVQRLWQGHRRWVAAILLAHKPAGAELEDLLQDVAMSFVRTIGKLRDEAMLKPWLRTVAINAARASGRSERRRRVRLVAPETVDGLVSVQDEGASRSEDSARILELATGLPDGYREPLLLRSVRGMSYRQIGELLGLPETTIETRIARGRRMLRELAEPRSAAGTDRAES